MAHIEVGTFTAAATAVAMDISCGFHPSYVKVINVSDGDTMEWFRAATALSGGGDAYGLKSLAGTAAQLKLTPVTSNGITGSGDASTDTFKGFTFGLDTDINIASKVYRYIALLEDGG